MGKHWMVGIVLVAAVVGFSGCATTGYQRANRASSTMLATRDELQAGRAQVTRTLNALSALVAAEAGDLRPKYAAFDREVAALRKSGERVRRRANAMRANVSAYFEEWMEEIKLIQSPDIQRESVKRRSETMQSYRKIEEVAKAVATAYDPLLAELGDIQAHLGQDLTAKGIGGARGFVTKARQDALALQQRTDAVVVELDRVSSEINAQAETGRQPSPKGL